MGGKEEKKDDPLGSQVACRIPVHSTLARNQALAPNPATEDAGNFGGA